METGTLLDTVPQSTCPLTLRTVLRAWQEGRVTGEDLVEASYMAQLDLLDEYRWRPLPTVPQAVAFQRSNNVKLSPAEAQEYQNKYGGFFKDESAAKARNYSNEATLQELVAWAEKKALPDTMLQAMRKLLRSWPHHQPQEAF